MPVWELDHHTAPSVGRERFNEWVDRGNVVYNVVAHHYISRWSEWRRVGPTAENSLRRDAPGCGGDRELIKHRLLLVNPNHRGDESRS